MASEWCRGNLLRVLFDICVTDAPPEALSKIDPKDIVATLHEAGLQALMFYVQCPTGWLYYPSEIGHQHPRLNGRDIIAECVDACHRRGLKFIGYFVPNEMGAELTLHPEWRTEWIGDSVPAGPRLWGNLCLNRPGCWEFCQGIVREALTRYEMDAIYVDNFFRRHCGCAYCQMRYRQETGREIPTDFLDPTNQYVIRHPERPEAAAYLHAGESWVRQWAMDLRRTVKEARPGCLIAFGYDAGDVHSSNYNDAVRVAADWTMTDSAVLGNQMQHSYYLKCNRASSPHLPFDTGIPVAEHHGDEISPKQEGLLKQQLAYVLALGSSVTYIDDMYWDGCISQKKYLRLKDLHAWARERFPYLGGDLVAGVGLYMSHESRLYHPQWFHWRWRSPRSGMGQGSIHHRGNAAFVQAMIRENVPFDVIHCHELSNLNRYKVIYMANVEVLGESEATALTEFVQNGGGLVVTHRTGMRNERLEPRLNFLLADTMGTDYVERPDVGTTHIVVGPDDRSEGFFGGGHPETPYFDAHGAQCYVSPREGTRWLGRVARPRRPYNEDTWPGPGLAPVRQLSNPGEIRQAYISHLYGPEIVTEYPAVVLKQHGQGRVVYCAACPICDYVDDIHDLIVALVNWAAGGRLDPTVTSNAPGPVEIIAMEQPDKGRTVVHAINWQPNWPGVAAHGVEVALRSPGRVAKRAFALEGACEVAIAMEGERLLFTFPPVEAWETVVIEWA